MTLEWPPLPKTVHSVLGPVRVIRPRKMEPGPDGTPTIGYWDPHHRTISVLRSLRRENAWLILHHEYVHLALHDMGNALNDPIREEYVCDALATALTAKMKAELEEVAV